MLHHLEKESLLKGKTLPRKLTIDKQDAGKLKNSIRGKAYIHLLAASYF